MIKYSSYTNHLRFSLRCHHNKILPKDLQLKSRIKTERSKTILEHGRYMRKIISLIITVLAYHKSYLEKALI